MRRPHFIASTVMVLVALGLAACGGGSAQSGFTTRGRPPANPSEWTWRKPSSQMADETEALITSKRGRIWASPECVPAKSLDGTGEFDFNCTVVDLGRKERRQLNVIVFGSESGQPVLGPIGGYVCDPGPVGETKPHHSC